jgi:hypothetical protein
MFRTPEGLIIPRDFTNKHHALWRKDWYKTPSEKRTREMAGLVVRMTINHHRDLHREVEPPRKPNPQVLNGMYNFNMHNLETLNVYDRFEALTEMLGKVAAVGGRNAGDAGELFDNLTAQLPFIQAGRVEVHRGE